MRAGVVLEANTSAYRLPLTAFGEGVLWVRVSLFVPALFVRARSFFESAGILWNAEGLAEGEIRRTCEARRESSQSELTLDLVDELPDFLPPTC